MNIVRNFWNTGALNGYFLVFIRKRPFSAVAASIRRLACDSDHPWTSPYGQPEAVPFSFPAEWCGVPMYASAQPLDFLATTKNCSFPIWKLRCIHPEFPDGYFLYSIL